jgi:hypothetical protein
MPENKVTLNGIKQWDSVCQSYVNLGLAELIKDTSKSGSADYVKVYNVFIGSGLDFKRVCWRLHFDERFGAESHLRVSDYGMEVMLKSITLMVALRKLNMKLSNNGKYDFEKLRKVMEEALVIVENRKNKEVIGHVTRRKSVK